MNKKIFSQLMLAIPVLILPLNSYAERDLTDLTTGDPFFYTSDQNIAEDDKQKVLLGTGRPNRTHSQIPHLPVYFGYMNTNTTYRFVNIVEQVFTMIGEGKHGLWRIHESGMVRLYRRTDSPGLAENTDLADKKNLSIIKHNYLSYLPTESWSGYKYPDQKIAEDGSLNFIDLPITHPIFNGKYAQHQPIDLPNWYCTMSANDYPYARKAMDFAFNQAAAGKVGPLGQRAGLDVNENYTKVLRLKQFPDAKTWVNVGQEGQDKNHVNWQAVDTRKTNVEIYLVERPFFNKPYLFLTAVYDNINNNDHQYIRPDGAYFDAVKHANYKAKTTVTQQPRFNLENGDNIAVTGLPVYGVHHHNRAVFGGGGACPLKGGDWGRYPETSGGSGWPTQYEEVTPLCDAVLIDIKLFTNLDGRSWNDPHKYLANAGVATQEVTYKMQAGEYGVFTDPYNTQRGVINKDSQQVPSELTLTYPAVEPVVGYIEPPVVAPALATGMVPSIVSTCRPVVVQAALQAD